MGRKRWKDRKVKISARESERRAMQSAMSPRKVSSAECDAWLESVRNESPKVEEPSDEPEQLGGVLRAVAGVLLANIALVVVVALYALTMGFCD